MSPERPSSSRRACSQSTRLRSAASILRTGGHRVGQRVADDSDVDAPLTIARYMTRSPHTVTADQPLAAARYIMRSRRVDHLPVLESGKLVGVLSDRELAAIELLPGADLLKVEDAMSPVTYVVAQNALLQWVAVDMARRKIGAAVITRGAHVVGVFTAVGALRALADALPVRGVTPGARRVLRSDR
jgi:CBS domain-containing protein